MRPGLQGQVILNTRPLHQQAALTALLEGDGATIQSADQVVFKGDTRAEALVFDLP